MVGAAPDDIVFVCPAASLWRSVLLRSLCGAGRRGSRGLAVFGWDSCPPCTRRGRCGEIYLPALALPGHDVLDDEPDWTAGIQRGGCQRGDVPALATRDSLRRLQDQVFDLVHGEITGVPGDAQPVYAAADEPPAVPAIPRQARLAALRRQGMTGETICPRSWQDWQTRDSHAPDANFYRAAPGGKLFFLGLNNSACRDLRRNGLPFSYSQIGEMPFLNGGSVRGSAGRQNDGGQCRGPVVAGRRPSPPCWTCSPATTSPSPKAPRTTWMSPWTRRCSAKSLSGS